VKKKRKKVAQWLGFSTTTKPERIQGRAQNLSAQVDSEFRFSQTPTCSCVATGQITIRRAKEIKHLENKKIKQHMKI
jgi:hypothetical protein